MYPFPCLPSSVQAYRDLFQSFSICLINRLKALEGKYSCSEVKINALRKAPLTELSGRKQHLMSGRAQ